MSANEFNSPRILILEADRKFAAMLQSFAVRGFRAASVQSITSRLESMSPDAERFRSFDVVIAGCDFKHDGSSDSPILKTIRALTADPAMPPIVLLAASGSEFTAAQAIKAGAVDYLPKALFGREQVTAAIQRAIESRRPFVPGSSPGSAPQLFGYALRNCLATNENASIHTAFSAEQCKEVVIKVFQRGRGSLSRDTRFARFVDEFRILHDIDDPAVAEIYDFRVTTDYCYIAMEYFELGPLAGRLREPLPPAEAMALSSEIAQALSIIHMAGVVHRDLKPGNIMLRADGGVALIDFGISRSTALDATDGSVISGTPYYMSPEQASGEATDERTDLYALGVIIYQMLTGEKPFGGADADEILRGHRESGIPVLPDELSNYQHLITRLLAKAPDDRISSARELVEIIERQLADGAYALSANSA